MSWIKDRVQNIDPMTWLALVAFLVVLLLLLGGFCLGYKVGVEHAAFQTGWNMGTEATIMTFNRELTRGGYYFRLRYDQDEDAYAIVHLPKPPFKRTLAGVKPEDRNVRKSRGNDNGNPGPGRGVPGGS